MEDEGQCSDSLILSNNNVLDYYDLQMSLGTLSNIIVGITFRGVG